jgi:hypothetical protein
MKKISTLALIATLTASTAFAGGMNAVTPEPAPEVVPEAAGSSVNGGLLVLLLLGLGLAAAASSSNGS